MKANILAFGAIGLLVAAPAVAQMGNSMSNGPTKAPMGQSQPRGSMGTSMTKQSGSMASGEANESSASEARENRMAMKHRMHYKKHHKVHHASKMPAKTGM